MIVHREEEAEVEQYFSAFMAEMLGKGTQPEPEDLADFFGRRPHLVLLLGFDEYRVLRKSPEAEYELRRYRPGPFRSNDYEPLFRRRESGEWMNLYSMWIDPEAKDFEKLLLMFWGSLPQAERIEYSVGDLVNRIHDAVASPPTQDSLIYIPQMWTPPAQDLVANSLRETIRPIINALREGDMDLEQLSPRQLEELVAELLRDRGMQVSVTKYRHDGGRDIIARGELVSCEPSYLAVEVKKKAVVGLRDVRDALYANRHFEALMIATSGRFSAGVLHEKDLPENRFRLHLKSGVALRQWLQLYSGGGIQR